MREDSISLAMIVKDEAADLTFCLESVRGQVDEIVVVDTGSTDETVAVARRYTERIYHYRWEDDFSAARNYALAHCRGRWVLVLDADEELEGDWGALKRLIEENPGREAFLLPLHQPADEDLVYTRWPVLRFFRNDPAYRFVGRIHEQVVVSRPEAVGFAAAPAIRHRPSPGRRRNRKRHRNLNLLRRVLAAEPENPFLRYYLGAEWLGLGRPVLALSYLGEARRALNSEQVLFRTAALCYLLGALRALGRYDEALAVCFEEVGHYPDYADLFFTGGVLLAEKGEYEPAAKWFKEALRCGPPPPGFFHVHGAAGFLALTHLGRCLEGLGRRKEAKEAHLRALAAEPACPAALGPLFALVISEYEPREAYEFFRARGFLDHCRSAEILAGLFFAAGFAGLAAECLKAAGRKEKAPESPATIRFLVYGGEYEEALARLEELRRRGETLDLVLLGEEVVALLLKGDLPAAKRRALEIWRRPDGRGPGWAFLNLVAWWQDGRPAGYPGGAHEAALIRTLLEVLDRCFRFSAGKDGMKEEKRSRYQTLMAQTMAVLRRLSPAGAAELAAYLQARAEAYRQMEEEC
ncbi:MAG: glycosyltransferase [Bacillota bacterium]